MKIVSVSTMKALDAEAIRLGIPGVTLMERAGEGLFREMTDFLESRLHPRHRRAFVILAGKGNNGGDGYVLARLLAERTPCPVTVCAVCPVTALRGEARAHAERLPDRVRTFSGELPDDVFAPGVVIVDALLGTGVRGSLRPPYDEWIDRVNASGRPVVAVDIPSGLNGDDGSVAGVAVIADLTVTMALPKSGLLRGRGPAHTGLLRCVDIGIPPELVRRAEATGEAIVAADAAALLGRRPREAHKNCFGHTLVLGGSKWYGGAPALSAEAALRSGCGLVTLAVPAHGLPSCRVPAALILRRLEDDGSGVLGLPALAQIGSLLDSARAVVFGPGLGRDPGALPILERLLASGLPLVIDADGLRLAASRPDMSEKLRKHPGPVVLTPHPGEMRILQAGFSLDRGPDRTGAAVELAMRTGTFVVLKGAGTVIAAPDGRDAINTSGSVALATAGTGDVLAGLLGGLLASGTPPWDALRLGVFVHGLAAEIAPMNGRALLADDLLAGIGSAFSSLSPFE